MHPYTTDTSAEAAAIQLEAMRQKSPAERIRSMCRLSANLRRMAMAAIRRRYVDIDEREARLKFIELTYGQELGEAVRNHLRKREGRLSDES